MSDNVGKMDFERIKEIVSFFGMIKSIDWSGQEVDFESGLVMVYRTSPEDLLALDKYLFDLQPDTDDIEFEPKETIKIILEGIEMVIIPHDKDIYVK